MKVYNKILGLIAGTVFSVLLGGCGSEAKIEEGMACISRMEYEKALLCFDEAKELGEDARLRLRGQGIAYLGLARYEEAIDSLEQCLQNSNFIVQDIDYDVNYYLAAAYCKQENWSKARAVYDAILGLRPKEADAYFYRGVAEIELDAYQAAVEDFEKVIALKPDDYDRIIHIYTVMEEKGHKEVGKTYLSDALERGEGKMSAYDKGRIYYYLEDYQKAYIALEEAKGKGGAESYLYLGKAYEATGDFNYATSVYSSYLSKEEPNAAIYNQLGNCEMKKQEYRKALDAFQAGLELGDTRMHQTLAFNQVVAYEKLGEFSYAASLLEEYLNLYPEDEVAKREYLFLSTR